MTRQLKDLVKSVHKSLKLITLYALLTPTLLFAQTTPTPTPVPPLSSYNWAISASPNLAANPPPLAVVTTFIQNVDGFQADNLCAFKFVPLNPSTGNLTLLANPGDLGGCSSEIDIVDRTTAGFVWNETDGFRDSSSDVGTGPQDVLHNGGVELVVYSQITDYQGSSHCASSWPVIYAWTGTSYSYVSTQAQYQPFYQQLLASLQNQYTTLPSDCLQAEIDKLQRVLGTPTAGLSNATTWASSSDPSVREFAASILADIGTSQAISSLQTLASDSNPVVAAAAQTDLSFGQTQPDPVEQQTISNPGGL
ncbi:MAG TPA: HEAT repeat domain-containing protein [Candidatus Binataceae bacterium]|nr:HEAT repeat domain-containing protein [Candidatus Binataceae bacterium]